jgi:FKBP-type peptidyl-prolyl cis-trans isomerase/predicted  nucleic acid-binding Zn-ribbon protein
LRSLKHYWQKAVARIRHPFKPHAEHAPRPEQLEQEISAVSSENRSLSAELGRVRSDFEHARSEEDRKITALEQVRDEIESAQTRDRHKLAELEQVSAELASTRSEQAQHIAALEQRLIELESERDRARQQAQALQDSLSATTARLDATDDQLKALQTLTEEHAETFNTSLTQATSRLQDTEDYIRTVEKDAEDRHRHHSGLIHEMQIAQRRQDRLLNRSIIAAGFFLLLGTIAGVVLILEVQGNSRVLAGMSQDMKAFMATVDQQLGRQQDSSELQPPPLAAIPEIPRPADTAPAIAPATVEDKQTPQPQKPENSATVSKPATNPYMLGSAFKRGRVTTREGIRQKTRKDASEFFTQNAIEPGIMETPTGLQYRIVHPGSGKMPTMADKVIVDYLATTTDGNVLDETYSSGFPKTVSMSEVNPAWREALLKMREGAEWELYVPPKLATKGGTRKRGMTGFEPTIYLLELRQVIDGTPEAR